MNNIHAMRIWNDTFGSVIGIKRNLDQLFDDTQESPLIPACDIDEKEDHYLLSLEIAGVKHEDIKMEISNHQINISGERRNETKSSETGKSYCERKYGKFHRSFTLPPGVDTRLIEASYQDGLLRIVVPKSESAKPRLVKISNENIEALR